jgi:very-short-patch-repair endonuclease
MLSKCLKDLSDDPADFRSRFERRVLSLVRRERFPIPVVNGVVLGYEVDFYWPEQRLVLEADSRGFHGTPQAVERDRERDLVLELADWEVIRITWRLLSEQPHRVAARLRSRL